MDTLVKSLETGGYLRRSRHPTHGRILLASLTTVGGGLSRRASPVALGIQDRVLSGLTAAECRGLRRLLHEIEQASAAGR